MALFGHTEAEFKAKCGENGVGGHIHIPARSDPKHSADVNRRWRFGMCPINCTRQLNPRTLSTYGVFLKKEFTKGKFHQKKN